MMNMTSKVTKQLLLLAVKYVPAIMALTCCFKIFLFEYTGDKPNIINWINVLLNIFIVLIFYLEGVVFRFCWKHRSLCRTALWGYVFYIGFMIFDPPGWFTIPLCIFYIILVIIMSITYEHI